MMTSSTAARPEDMKPYGRWKPLSVVFGGMLIHTSLGMIFTFGNMNPYVTSYMRKAGSAPGLTYAESSWIFAAGLMAQGVSMLLGGLVERKLGPGPTTLLSSWFFSLGIVLTYFSIKTSFGLTVVTYGIMFGLGFGCALAVPMGCAMKRPMKKSGPNLDKFTVFGSVYLWLLWLPDNKGLATGGIVAGFGGGTFIFVQIQTSYINPYDLKPDRIVGNEEYFEQDVLLSRVPSSFLIMGGCTVVLQLVGSLLLRNPPALELEMCIEEECEVIQSVKDKEKIPLLGSKSQLTSEYKDIELNPCQVLKSRYFYMLFFMYMLNIEGVMIITSFYKAYGQTFIQDDSFLALVGSISSLFNGFGRLFWGRLADRYSFRTACLLMNASYVGLMLTMPVTELAGKYLFLVYVCLLYGTSSGGSTLYPTATASCFGRKYLTFNFGLVVTSLAVVAPVGVFGVQLVLEPFGWSGIFYLVAAFNFFNLLLSFAFNAKDWKGNEI